MFELVGFQTDYVPNPDGTTSEHEREEVVATFDTRRQALDYIRKSKLKHPRRPSWDDGCPFKSRSLLAGFAYAEVRGKDPDDRPIHNPTI